MKTSYCFIIALLFDSFDCKISREGKYGDVDMPNVTGRQVQKKHPCM